VGSLSSVKTMLALAIALANHGHHISYDDSQAKQVPRSVRTAVAELARIARGGR
jgi:hypothetical protein